MAKLKKDPKPHPGANLTIPISARVYREREKVRQIQAARIEERDRKTQERFAIKAQKERDQFAALAVITEGAETWGQISAGLGFEASRLRSALRALVKSGAVVKLSARRYGPK